MAGTVVDRDGGVRRHMMMIAALLLLLLLLLVFYYMLTRPAELVGEELPQYDDFEFVRSIYGFEGDLLHRPSGVHIGPDGRLYVADTGKHRIVIFDMEGRFVGAIHGQTLDEPHRFMFPLSVAVAEDGRIYVLSRQDRKIVVFDANRRPVDLISFPDLLPTDVQIDDDRLFVTTDKAILVGTLDGTPVQQIGMPGDAEGRFDLPGGLAVDETGDVLYVADTLNYRVQAIAKETGEPLWVYGEPLPPGEAIKYRGPGRKFGLPARIARDEMGKLYIVDGTNSEIVILDEETGAFVRTVGEAGHADGYFYYPDGIAYGAGGYIAVADKFNDRVTLFRVPSPEVVPEVARWLPVALLPLLAALLWLVFRRRTRFVATADFLTGTIERGYSEDLARHAKRLYVTPATHSMFLGRFEAPKLLEITPDEGTLAEVKEAFDLDEPLREALAIACRLKGKRVLLTEAPSARQAADELDIIAMSVEDLIERRVFDTPAIETEAGR